MRKRFYEVLIESVNNKKDNTFYLTSERYNSLIYIKNQRDAIWQYVY
jgi:hypothetical protein